MLVLTRGFKRANLELWSDGAQGFKNELCYVCSVLVSTYGFKNELCYVCSVLVSTHGFKNELCHMCTVLVSTHSFKNEICHMCGVLLATFRLMLHVKRASLDLGLKNESMLQVQFPCFDSWHD